VRQPRRARAKALRLTISRFEGRRWIIFPVICQLPSKATVSTGMAHRGLTTLVNNWPITDSTNLCLGPQNLPRQPNQQAKTKSAQAPLTRHRRVQRPPYGIRAVCANSPSKETMNPLPRPPTFRKETGRDRQRDPRALTTSRSAGCEILFIATSKGAGVGIWPSPACSASRRRRVDRQRKALNRGQYRTGIIHILKLDRLDKLIHIILWWKVGHVGVAQDRWSRIR
jgi:hypothetical protein